MQSENILDKVKEFETLVENLESDKNENKIQQKRNLKKCFMSILAFCTKSSESSNWSLSIYTFDLIYMLAKKFNLDKIFDSEKDCELLILYGKAFVH